MVEKIEPITGQKLAKSEYWDIDRLTNWDKNPRSIKTDRFIELKNRLKRLGQTKPLRVTKNGVVIGGNMRLRAMKDLGINSVWVSISDASTDKQIFDEALTDNEEFGYYEQEQVAELALQLGFSSLELKNYEINLASSSTIDILLGNLGPGDYSDKNSEINTEGLMNDSTHTCPKCGFEFEK